MNPARSIRVPLSLIIALLTVVVCYVGNVRYYQSKYPAGDPDRYFHYAISKQTATQGLIREIPQIEDLGWNKYFPDKAFLFHVFGAVGYRLGAETGANAVGYVFGFATFLTLLIASIRLIGIPRATLLVLGLGLMNPYFSPRMTFFRAHVPAVFFFSLFLISLSSMNVWLAAIMACLFVLTYHAFYLLLIAIGIAFMATYLEPSSPTRALWRKCLYYSLGGVLVGVCLNPYFPSNLIAGVEQLRIALFYPANMPGVYVGGELASLSLRHFLIAFGPDLAALVFSLIAIRRVPSRNRMVPLFLIALSLTFWLLAIRTPRSCEYAIPATILALAFSLKQQGTLKKSSFVFLILTAVLPGSYFVKIANDPKNLKGLSNAKSIFAALKAIPSSATPGKVLNCDWSFGSYLLYARPDLHFVDALDARALQFVEPRKFELLRQMKLGRVRDLYGAVQMFKSDYVLCDEPMLNLELERDPHFSLLYRPQEEMLDGAKFQSPVRLYQVNLKTEVRSQQRR